MSMQTIIAEDAAELAFLAADQIAQAIHRKPDLTILAATGNTPMGTYAQLAEACELGLLDTSRVRILQLDEYVGAKPGDANALYGWMDRALLQPLKVAPDRVVALRGDANDPAAACAEYVRTVAALGGIDLAILGLGPNGHLGFNEPPSDATAPTRLVTLTEASLISNAAYWGGRDRVPSRALTVGMDLILAARQILLLVSGAGKRDIARRLIDGPTTPEIPATYLRDCPQATLILDAAAAE